jgi:hypothetical protein
LEAAGLLAVAAFVVGVYFVAVEVHRRARLWWRRWWPAHKFVFQGVVAVGMLAAAGVAAVAPRVGAVGRVWPAVAGGAAVVAAGAVAVWRRGRRVGSGPTSWSPPLDGKWARVVDRLGRDDLVYAFGLQNRVTNRIDDVKPGHSAQEAGKREAQVEAEQAPNVDPATGRSRTHRVVRLASGHGGETRERQIHARLGARFRHDGSEWWAITDENRAQIVAEVKALGNLTAHGRLFLEQHDKGSRR